jgi:hypothetical protein
MKIQSIDEVPSVKRFKNKEDFCNRIIQEVTSISKNYLLSKNSNKKIIELENHKKDLISKNEKMNLLLEKASVMQKELIEKTNLLVEENNLYRDTLLNLLENKEN